MKKVEHTLMPLSCERQESSNGFEQGEHDWSIVDKNNIVIAETFAIVGRTGEGRFIKYPAQANAEFIVRACNSNNDLLTACKEALLGLEQLGDADGTLGDQLRVAIAKAKGAP